MNFLDIREKALFESRKDQKFYLDKVKNQIDQFPNGSDLTIGSSCIESLEAYCDSEGIPFYIVGNNVCSVAKTYSKLFEFEMKR